MKLSIQTVDPMIFFAQKKIKVSGRFPDEALPLDPTGEISIRSTNCLVVFRLPLWKMMLREWKSLGMIFHSQLFLESQNPVMFQTTNQIIKHHLHDPTSSQGGHRWPFYQ